MNSETQKELIALSANAAYNYKFKQEVPQRPNPLKLSKWLSQEIEEINEQIDCIEAEVNVDIVNIGLHFFLKNVRPMLPPVTKHNTAVA